MASSVMLTPHLRTRFVHLKKIIFVSTLEFLLEHNYPHNCTSVFSNEVHYPLFMSVDLMYRYYWFAYTIWGFMKYIIHNYLCV